MQPNSLRVAVTQHEPVWLDLDATVEKTCKIIAGAAGKGAKLVAFPECWIPGYPAWIWNRPVDFDLGTRYIENSLSLNSPEFTRIQTAAKESQIAVSLGFSERAGDSVYIAQAFITSSGDVAMTRRKMKPTHMERTIFGDASGDCLAPVVKIDVDEETSSGNEESGTTMSTTNKKTTANVGNLSCWEHIQPLLKYYTFSQGEQVHVSAWPPLDGFIEGSPGFFSMSVEGCLNLSQTYAIESQSFVLHCTSALTETGIDLMKTAGTPIMGNTIAGSSAIIGPDGRVLAKADPTADGGEQLIVADLDLSLVIKTKTFADASGHYSRPDMLWLGADPTVKPIIRVTKAA